MNRFVLLRLNVITLILSSELVIVHYSNNGEHGQTLIKRIQNLKIERTSKEGVGCLPLSQDVVYLQDAEKV